MFFIGNCALVQVMVLPETVVVNMPAPTTVARMVCVLCCAVVSPKSVPWKTEAPSSAPMSP